MVSWVFFVRSAELSCCPVCFEALEIIGSRERTWRKRDGEKNILIIRRLRCTRYKTIHHELPDFLVPYKRYDAESIELGITQGSQSDVAADESTLNRWRTWFHWIVSYWLGCLHALLHSFAQPVERSSPPSQSALHDIGRLLGHQFGWLSRVVQLVVNHHFWVHTRSAFLSAKFLYACSKGNNRRSSRLQGQIRLRVRTPIYFRPLICLLSLLQKYCEIATPIFIHGGGRKAMSD
jgi:hypothetical protein